ncbi:hypothetical protein [Bradyrhizobium sp.]|uniref:hypothetical protein n=1 Tax=Bradyrhizobium sp. TaxID=376 RepID=UPI00262C0429|nr:hypothetical protein [Bradyrhizobium sp.]
MSSRLRTVQFSNMEQDVRHLALVRASIARGRKVLADNPPPGAFAGRRIEVPIAGASNGDDENILVGETTIMNRKLEQRHLAQADAHIAAAKRLISEQTARVEKLRRHRHDIRLAEETLRAFEVNLQTLCEHREVIVMTIEQMDRDLQGAR